MRKISMQILGATLVFIMVAGVIPTEGAAVEFPDWLPQPEDITGYDLMWNGTQSFNNYICTDDDNITTFSQVWYRNDTGNNLLSVIAEGYMDFGFDIMGEPAGLVQKLDPEFDGSTRWDYFVYFLEGLTDGNVTDVSGELDGWDRAVESNRSDPLFNYFIVGTIGGRIVVSFALEVDSSYWWSISAAAIQFSIGTIITWFITATVMLTTVTVECPNSAGIVPQSASTEDYTSRDEMITFNSQIGQIMADGGGIPGYNVLLIVLVGSITSFVVLRKKKTQI